MSQCFEDQRGIHFYKLGWEEKTATVAALKAIFLTQSLLKQSPLIMLKLISYFPRTAVFKKRTASLAGSAYVQVVFTGISEQPSHEG